MKRDWDKLKRQDKARSSYDPIVAFRHAMLKRYKPHQGKKRAQQRSRLFQKPPDLERTLAIECDPIHGPALLSRWRRTKGKWHCITADAPIEWFTRSSSAAVETWLNTKKISFKWSKATPVCRAHNQHTEDNTAEAYPPSQASAPSGINTVASLNNPSPVPVCTSRTATEPGLEQDGVASPHCLIGADRTAQPETSVNRS